MPTIERISNKVHRKIAKKNIIKNSLQTEFIAMNFIGKNRLHVYSNRCNCIGLIGEFRLISRMLSMESFSTFLRDAIPNSNAPVFNCAWNSNNGEVSYKPMQHISRWNSIGIVFWHSEQRSENYDWINRRDSLTENSWARRIRLCEAGRLVCAYSRMKTLE